MAESLLLIAGESGTGKTASLRNLKNPSSVLYINCEGNKRLPFKQDSEDKFRELHTPLTDPRDLPGILAKAEETKEIKTIVIDSLTFLMDLYETQIIRNAADSRAEWAAYGDYAKNLIQVIAARSRKNYIFLAHNVVERNNSGDERIHVKLKGSVMSQGIEAYFNQIVYTRTIPVFALENTKYDHALLHIDEDDKLLGYKYVFQTRKTPDLVNSRIRSPLGMFTKEQVYIDNDAQMLLDHINEYYGT